MERRGRKFNSEQMKIIREKINKRKDTDEMSLVIFLMMETELGIKQLLGWFNNNPEKRQTYLKERDDGLMEEYAAVPKLFPKTHQAYLNQWKMKCYQWTGVPNATFEMIKRSKI